MENINKDEFNLKIKGENISFEVKGKVNTSFIREIRKLVETVYNSEDYTDEYLEEELNYSLIEISPDLKRRKDFRNIVKELIYSEEQSIIKKISIPNVLSIKVNKSEKSVNSYLNINEWKKEIEKVFFGVNPKKLSYVILHITSSLENSEIESLKDMITKHVFLKPIKTFVTRKESLPKTNVELLLFGNAFINDSEEDR